MAAAKSKAGSGKSWDAYKAYNDITETFKDYPEAKQASAELVKLRSDPKVSRELQARGIMDNAATLLNSKKKSDHQTALAELETLHKQFAGTDAENAAKSMK